MANRYPDHPGHRGNMDTSIAAADSIADEAATRRAKARTIFQAVQLRGATADEVASNLGWNKYSVRPRLSELRREGVIIDTGKRRPGESGRMQAVWMLAEYASEGGAQ